MLDTTVRATFSERAVVLSESYLWEASPTPGVHRVKLDRIGLEVARATSLVHYEPNQRFPFHRHDGGEEILVLRGTFIDDDGIYPVGTYLRNPPGSNHQPRLDLKVHCCLSNCINFKKAMSKPVKFTHENLIGSPVSYLD